MLIFSIDFLHKVSPIIEGTRYVFKAVIEKSDQGEEEEEVEIDLHNGFLDGCGHDDDY